jgi:hypothetical protein
MIRTCTRIGFAIFPAAHLWRPYLRLLQFHLPQYLLIAFINCLCNMVKLSRHDSHEMVLKSKLVSMTGEKTKLFLNKLPRYFFSFGSAAGNSLGAGSKGKVNLTQNDKEKGRQDPPAALRREYPDPVILLSRYPQ